MNCGDNAAEHISHVGLRTKHPQINSATQADRTNHRYAEKVIWGTVHPPGTCKTPAKQDTARCKDPADPFTPELMGFWAACLPELVNVPTESQSGIPTVPMTIRNSTTGCIYYYLHAVCCVFSVLISTNTAFLYMPTLLLIHLSNCCVIFFFFFPLLSRTKCLVYSKFLLMYLASL